MVRKATGGKLRIRIPPSRRIGTQMQSRRADTTVRTRKRAASTWFREEIGARIPLGREAQIEHHLSARRMRDNIAANGRNVNSTYAFRLFGFRNTLPAVVAPREEIAGLSGEHADQPSG